MTKQEFREFYQNKLIYLDGATGSNLQKAGMPTGVCPEQWILEHPDAILELQRACLLYTSSVRPILILSIRTD